MLNKASINPAAIRAYRKALNNSSPKYVVIDDLFNSEYLENVLDELQHAGNWQTQKHVYSKLYVNDDVWQQSEPNERFVQRDVWLTERSSKQSKLNVADAFLVFLRSVEFMALLSRIFRVYLTDSNVANPKVNTNYFRLGPTDFVKQHADDSPSREVCLLLYLNRDWQQNKGGELMFTGTGGQAVKILPTFNRCVLFDPASPGAEHWVNALCDNETFVDSNNPLYRYNVTSWYWSE